MAASLQPQVHMHRPSTPPRLLSGCQPCSLHFSLNFSFRLSISSLLEQFLLLAFKHLAPSPATSAPTFIPPTEQLLCCGALTSTLQEFLQVSPVLSSSYGEGRWVASPATNASTPQPSQPLGQRHLRCHQLLFGHTRHSLPEHTRSMCRHSVPSMGTYAKQCLQFVCALCPSSRMHTPTSSTAQLASPRWSVAHSHHPNLDKGRQPC